jgi:hypothetical protein
MQAQMGWHRRDAFKHRCATQRTMIGMGCGAPKALVSVIANGTANNRCLDLIPGTDASMTYRDLNDKQPAF